MKFPQYSLQRLAQLKVAQFALACQKASRRQPEAEAIAASGTSIARPPVGRARDRRETASGVSVLMWRGDKAMSSAERQRKRRAKTPPPPFDAHRMARDLALELVATDKIELLVAALVWEIGADSFVTHHVSVDREHITMVLAQEFRGGLTDAARRDALDRFAAALRHAEETVTQRHETQGKAHSVPAVVRPDPEPAPKPRKKPGKTWRTNPEIARMAQVMREKMAARLAARMGAPVPNAKERVAEAKAAVVRAHPDKGGRSEDFHVALSELKKARQAVPEAVAAAEKSAQQLAKEIARRGKKAAPKV